MSCFIIDSQDHFLVLSLTSLAEIIMAGLSRMLGGTFFADERAATGIASNVKPGCVREVMLALQDLAQLQRSLKHQ